MDDKQAVVDETKVSAEPDAAVDSARDDGIDALLAEFDQKTQAVSPPESKVDTKLPDDPPSWAKEILNRQFQEDIKKVGDAIFEGLEIPDRARKGWLTSFAQEYPAADAAYKNRQNDPRTWQRWEKQLQREAQRDFPNARKVDVDATADHNAVAAAVRGASAKITAEPPPKLGQMSDNELREYTRKNFGFV